ncbi:MAG: cation transporter [Cyclobacteriaceae bacterium]|nr:cation transporter [Cyclobacteriaceae bacterium]
MEKLLFKTNIKCDGCIAKVKQSLNEVAGENNWQVDITNPTKILTITGTATATDIIESLNNVGYKAEKLENA